MSPEDADTCDVTYVVMTKRNKAVAAL